MTATGANMLVVPGAGLQRCALCSSVDDRSRICLCKSLGAVACPWRRCWLVKHLLHIMVGGLRVDGVRGTNLLALASRSDETLS